MFLYDASTDEPIRKASKQEIRRYVRASEHGAGVISISGIRCYVQEG